MTIIKVPKHFNDNSILEFIDKVSPLFNLKNKMAPGYAFDLGDHVLECSMLGALVFYKIIEYTVINRCFDTPIIAFEKVTTAAFKRYGFWDLIMDYMVDKESVEKTYRNLEVKISDEFIIAPQALLRDSNFSSDSLKKKFLPRIEEYYGDNPVSFPKVRPFKS